MHILGLTNGSRLYYVMNTLYMMIELKKVNIKNKRTKLSHNHRVLYYLTLIWSQCPILLHLQLLVCPHQRYKRVTDGTRSIVLLRRIIFRFFMAISTNGRFPFHTHHLNCNWKTTFHTTIVTSDWLMESVIPNQALK